MVSVAPGTKRRRLLTIIKPEVTLCDDLVTCFSKPGNHDSADLSNTLRFLKRADQSLEEQANRPAAALQAIFQMREKISQAKVIGELARYLRLKLSLSIKSWL